MRLIARIRSWTPGRWALLAIPMLVAVASGLTVLATSAHADDDEHAEGSHFSSRHEGREQHHGHEGRPAAASRVAAMPPAYRQECAACHMAYDPRMLPASSWNAIMGSLSRHYGTDASVDVATARTISQYLQKEAGQGRRTDTERPPQDRITRSRWFVHKHHEIAASTFKRASIRSPANCMACHRGADKGDYDEDRVRIPR